VGVDGATWPARIGAVSQEPELEREFEARLQDSSGLAFRVALSVLRRREDAEDVAQEAFLRAHRSFGSLQDRDRFRAWIVRMTFRLALDHVRGEKRRARRDDVVARDATLVAASAEEDLLHDELRSQVTGAVAALPAKLRLVVVLVAIEGQDLASVARLLELPLGTVKTRLHRARKQLAERLRWIAGDIATR
jgi:RNA polymerase sigma-70 factor (ECF subfamily)